MTFEKLKKRIPTSTTPDEQIRLRKWNEGLEVGWHAGRKSVLTYVAEAEYAMVAGNLIKEDIDWNTADGWFRWIYKKVWGKEK